jgi:hypothetical protein
MIKAALGFAGSQENPQQILSSALGPTPIKYIAHDPSQVSGCTYACCGKVRNGRT